MLKLSIILGLLTSLIWRTALTSCNQTLMLSNNNNQSVNVNEKLAKNIINYIDSKNARPCENFYQYACGNWYQQYIDEFGFHDTLEMLNYELNNKLEHILKMNSDGSENSMEEHLPTNVTNTDTDTDIYKKVRTYYKSCRRVKPYNLKKFLQLVPPGSSDATWWVLTHNRPQGMRQWEPHNFEWLAAIAKLRLYGLNGVLLREEVLPRWDQAQNNSIYLDKPNLSETQPIASGWTAWVEIFLDIGQTKRVANEIARKVYTFEMQLHALQEIEDDEGVKEMRLSYLHEYLPQLNWLEYLQALNQSNKQHIISKEMTVIIRNLPYMRALVKLVNGVERETLCNYIMLKFIQFLKQRGPAEITKQECISSLRRAMPLAVSHILAHKFLKDAKYNDRMVKRLFIQLQHKFSETLSDNRLQLPHSIVQMLVQKINQMRLQVGTAPQNVSVEFYNDYYAPVTIDANNFYVNQLNLLRVTVEKSHESLVQVAADNNTNTTADIYVLHENLDGSSSSPFYVKPKNMIIIPHGFLQMPIYHGQLLNIYKYSVLGFFIAHELVHGFDASGIDYDSEGNIMGPSEEIMLNPRFTQGLRCMQQNVESFGKQENRKLNEKIADFEGLRLAYSTYFNGSQRHNYTAQYKLETTAIELLSNFTEQQVFFLNFAQFFCGKEYRDMGQKAMDELRVLQLFNNFEEFGNAFGCARRLKSKNRCRLW